jgi:hypothetical protein
MLNLNQPKLSQSKRHHNLRKLQAQYPDLMFLHCKVIILGGTLADLLREMRKTGGLQILMETTPPFWSKFLRPDSITADIATRTQ